MAPRTLPRSRQRLCKYWSLLLSPCYRLWDQGSEMSPSPSQSLISMPRFGSNQVHRCSTNLGALTKHLTKVPPLWLSPPRHGNPISRPLTLSVSLLRIWQTIPHPSAQRSSWYSPQHWVRLAHGQANSLLSPPGQTRTRPSGSCTERHLLLICSGSHSPSSPTNQQVKE